MEIKALARIRKMLEGVDSAAPGDDEMVTMSPQLEALVAQGAAPYREVARMGRAFYVSNVTPVAAVVAIPTTTQNLALFNNEPDGGRSYVIDWVGIQGSASAAAASEAQLLCLQGQVREAIPADAGFVIKKCNGLGTSADTRARTTIASGTALPAGTGIAASWTPFGPNCAKPGVTAVGGYGLFVPIDGRFICPPGRYFAVQVISAIATETFVATIAWHEVQTQLG